MPRRDPYQKLTAGFLVPVLSYLLRAQEYTTARIDIEAVFFDASPLVSVLDVALHASVHDARAISGPFFVHFGWCGKNPNAGTLEHYCCIYLLRDDRATY